MIRLFVMPLIMLAAAPAFAAEPRTAAAVIAADKAWGEAEVAGNADFVDRLLLPGYVSIGPDGKTTTKEKIVAGARGRDKQASEKLAAEVAAWKAAHPTRSEVILNGDTAVLKWVMIKPDGSVPISSCDIFVYRGGRWHAIYSQHTTASS